MGKAQFMDERGLAMRDSYWARWACNGQVTDLPTLILPHLLKQGYQVLAHNEDRQVSDRGEVVMEKMTWSFRNGRWNESPVNLTITCSYSPTQTIANFYWKLSEQPSGVAKAQSSFETRIKRELDRIIAVIDEGLIDLPDEDEIEAAQEGADLQTCWELGSQGDETGSGWQKPAGPTTHALPNRTAAQAATTCIEKHASCDICHGLAVPLAGSANRYFCVMCRHQLSCPPAA